MDDRIEKLTEQGARDRLIKELSSQQRALIAEFHRRVAPLVPQESELQEHTTGRKKEHRKLYHSVYSSCSLSLVSCLLVRNSDQGFHLLSYLDMRGIELKLIIASISPSPDNQGIEPIDL